MSKLTKRALFVLAASTALGVSVFVENRAPRDVQGLVPGSSLSVPRTSSMHDRITNDPHAEERATLGRVLPAILENIPRSSASLGGPADGAGCGVDTTDIARPESQADLESIMNRYVVACHSELMGALKHVYAFTERYAPPSENYPSYPYPPVYGEP
jgi:hypothetical protein